MVATARNSVGKIDKKNTAFCFDDSHMILITHSKGYLQNVA